MKLSDRQEEIIKLVKEGQPITSEALADKSSIKSRSCNFNYDRNIGR